MASTRRASRFTARALLAGAALLALAGCNSILMPGPVASEPLPPVPTGDARLIFYRAVDYQGTQAMPEIALNGAPTARSENGTTFYRDVAPGNYIITATPTLPYPNQFPSLAVKAGDVDYVQIGTLSKMGDIVPTQRSDEDTFILSVVDPQTGAFGAYGLRRIHG